MKGQKIMHIELKYFNPNTGTVSHFFFPDIESTLALDYYNDAERCGCIIITWRLIRTSDIKVN